MARDTLLQLDNIHLTFGGDPVFSDISLSIAQGDCISLVGRNGSGKSTLMKLMAGVVEADSGERVLRGDVATGYMEQDPDLSVFASLGDFAADGLPDAELYKIERAGAGLKFDPDRPVSTASGGERRRAALARLLAQDAGLLLLDEPTNHLDIEAISWLEEELASIRAGQVIISHDRAFLNRLTRSTLWLDRGVLRRRDGRFEGFESWRDEVWEEEALQRHKLDRKIKAEARWAVEGISARRKRNQGRLRALHSLKAERASQITRQGRAALAIDGGTRSGKLVIEAQEVHKTFGNTQIAQGFSIKIARGDRVALVGPNGVGKTTLIKLLLGQIAPDAGSVRHGTNLDIAVFDQNRAALDPDMSLWDSLTGDKDMRVSGNADQVMVRGTAKHVVAYLKEYLFDEAQARAPVRSLSGGEKARLLLAKLMAKPSNLLVLDEPTNDLDIEMLDLLQEVLDDFPGTVLLVSHDRDFLDRVANTTLWMDGDGVVTAYAGGWQDAVAQRGRDGFGVSNDKRVKTPKLSQSATGKVTQKTAQKPALSYKEKYRLSQLPGEIEKLEAEIAKLEALLADPKLYQADPGKFHKGTEALAVRQDRLAKAEEEWLLLEEKADMQK